MKTIYAMNDMVHRLLPDIQASVASTFRPISFCIKTEVADGLLIYNTLTKEFLLLEGEEATALNEKHPHSQTSHLLVSHYFLVPVDFDDCKLADEINQLVAAIEESKCDGKITGCTILTTTDCNARCYYCYENGCKRVNMSIETAHDVAAYLQKNIRKDRILLNLFGGEPLFNANVIDTICNDLSNAGIKYTSHMASNAYLFDEQMIQKAINLWHLTEVQVTLDGTEEIYNVTKSYINAATNPFQTVINNIQELIRNNIHISIRLNLGRDNYEDMKKLILYLSSVLPDDERSRIYVRLLFEIEHCEDQQYRASMIHKLNELQALIEMNNKASQTRLKRTIGYWHCQAMGCDSIVIDPEGNLYPCEHFTECDSCGTIYSDQNKFDGIASRKERIAKQTDCERCCVYPICFNTQFCPATSKVCIPALRESKSDQMIKQMKNDYIDFVIYSIDKKNK